MAVKVITAPADQWRAAGRVVGWTLGVCLATLLGYWAWSEAAHFLQQDSRFLLAVPELGESSKGIIVEGLKHGSRSSIANIFSDDYGRSIYSIPIANFAGFLHQLQQTADSKLTVFPFVLCCDTRQNGKVE